MVDVDKVVILSYFISTDKEEDLLHRRYLAILRIAESNHHLLVLNYP